MPATHDLARLERLAPSRGEGLLCLTETTFAFRHRNTVETWLCLTMRKQADTRLSTNVEAKGPYSCPVARLRSKAARRNLSAQTFGNAIIIGTASETTRFGLRASGCGAVW